VPVSLTNPLITTSPRKACRKPGRSAGTEESRAGAAGGSRQRPGTHPGHNTTLKGWLPKFPHLKNSYNI